MTSKALLETMAEAGFSVINECINAIRALVPKEKGDG